jgi:hypothetical protein
MVYPIHMDHTQCLVFRKRPLMQCPQLFCCCMCSYLSDERPSVVTGWWWTESKGLKMDMHGHHQCVKWYSWSILIIHNVLYSEKGWKCNAHNYFPVACSSLTPRPAFVTCDEWSQRDWRRTFMGTSSVSNGVAGLYIDHTQRLIFRQRRLMECPQLFCSCMFILDTEAIICHLWWMESKGLKKDMHGYLQCVKWYSWSIWIIFYVLYSEWGHCCNAHNYFAFACVHICHKGYHLSLVMNGVKGTEEGHAWVPSMCQMVKLVYIDHTQCLVFRRRLEMQCPQWFSWWMFIFDTQAIICHKLWMESKWPKKDMHGYLQCVKRYSWSRLIILFMSCVQKEAIAWAVMPRIILLWHVHICGRGHHLSLVMNGVKVTQERQLWVPAAVCHLV